MLQLGELAVALSLLRVVVAKLRLCFEQLPLQRAELLGERGTLRLVLDEHALQLVERPACEGSGGVRGTRARIRGGLHHFHLELDVVIHDDDKLAGHRGHVLDLLVRDERLQLAHKARSPRVVRLNLERPRPVVEGGGVVSGVERTVARFQEVINRHYGLVCHDLRCVEGNNVPREYRSRRCAPSFAWIRAGTAQRA